MKKVIYRLFNTSTFLNNILFLYIFFISFDGLIGIFFLWLVKCIFSIMTFFISNKFFRLKDLLWWDISIICSLSLLGYGYSQKNYLLIMTAIVIWQFCTRFSEHLHKKYVSFILKGNKQSISDYSGYIIVALMVFFYNEEILSLLILSILLRFPVLFILNINFKDFEKEGYDSAHNRWLKLIQGYRNFLLLNYRLKNSFVLALLTATFFRILELRLLGVAEIETSYIPFYFLISSLGMFLVPKSFSVIVLKYNKTYMCMLLLLSIILFKFNSVSYLFLASVFSLFLMIFNQDLLQKLMNQISSKEIFVFYSYCLMVCNILVIGIEIYNAQILLVFCILLIIHQMRDKIGNSRLYTATNRTDSR